MLRHQPARREDHEIHIRGTGHWRWRGEHGIDRGIGMIETHCIDAIEVARSYLYGA